MPTAYFENGPMDGKTAEIKAGAYAYEYLSPFGGKIEWIGGNPFIDPATIPPVVQYWRAGRLHEGMPVFTCNASLTEGASNATY